MILAFAVEDRAISRRIGQAESRAEMRCKTYDAETPYWLAVDKLLEKQETMLEIIAKSNAVDVSHVTDISTVRSLIFVNVLFHDMIIYHN